MSSRLVTARKRSLGQGKVFTPICHSVHFLGRPPRQTPPKQTPPRQTPLLGRHTLVQTPPDRYAPGQTLPPWQTPPRQTPPRQTPSRQTHSPGQTPPGRHPSWVNNCPWADTPLGRHPPGQTPPDSQTGSTHPNGVHSCLKLIWWQKEFL